MSKQYRVYLLTLAAAGLLLGPGLRAQSPVSIKLYGTDGSGITDSLTLAVHPAGTNDSPCMADSLSPTLKESSQGLPPPPQGLDLRVIPYTGYDCLANYTSIHHLAYDTQLDYWKIQFQRDASQTGMDFFWQSGLDSIGAGYWKIVGDPNDADASIASLDVDMTQTTQLHVNIPDTDPHTFYLKKGDGAKMRTFTPDEIADAVDSKGKRAKAEKRKNYKNDWCFFFQNTTQDTVGHLYVQVNQNAEILSSSGWTVNGNNTKKLDFFAPESLYPGQSMEICGIGDKGKPIKVSRWYWVDALGKPLNKIKYKMFTGGHTVEHDRLWLRMPNINNIGEEAYAQNVWTETYKGKPAGIVIGSQNQAGLNSRLKPYYKFVYHPKWKDVTKTLYDRKTGKHTEAAKCLDNFVNTKPILKGTKTLPSKKHNNILLAEAVALAFNIGIGDAHKTETDGFGDLIYMKQAGDPEGLPDGSTVREIDVMMDSVMSCISTRIGTFAEWDSVLHRLNRSFSDNGNFDTLSFGQLQGPKTAGGTIATGVRPIAEVEFVYRTSSVATPVTIAPLDLTKLEPPKQYQLAQNYPNPFNPTTTIEFSLPEDAVVTLTVYNMLGQQVAKLADHEDFTDGVNDVTLDASNMASGVYFYRIVAQPLDDNGNVSKASPFVSVKKMMFVK